MDIQLRAAWAHVLGLESSYISNDSHFFLEGGDSVQAMRLITAARERNIGLDTATIFLHPVFADMVKTLCRPTEPGNGLELDPRSELDENDIRACARACDVEQESIEDIFPATDFQVLAFYQHMASGTMTFQIVLETDGAFDLDLLRQVWQHLHDKNHILRTRLVNRHDRILQVVVNDNIQWGIGHDLAQYKVSDMSRRIGSGDSLFRYAIVNEGDRVFVVWTCHHGAFDGWTWRLIMDRLQEGLRDVGKGMSEPHYPQFKSFVEWRSSQSDKSKATAFWKQYLTGYQHLKDIRCPSPDYVALGSSHFSKTLKVAASANSTVTLSTIGHAAWAVALGSLWSVEDVLFATVKMGRQMPRDRPLPKVEFIMGPTAVINPMRVVLRRHMTVGHFLQQVQDQLISMIPYEHEGWSTFRECFGAQAILPGIINWHPLGSEPLSRTLEYKAKSGEVGFLRPRRDFSTTFIINCSMLVDIYEYERHLNVRVSYDGNIWTEKVVIKLVETFTGVLTQILTSKAFKVSELSGDGAEGVARLKARL